MAKENEPRNGRITPDTAISLKLVIGVAVIIIAVMASWYDLKGAIREVDHRIDIYHGPVVETIGTS